MYQFVNDPANKVDLSTKPPPEVYWPGVVKRWRWLVKEASRAVAQELRCHPPSPRCQPVLHAAT
jgi:hypothetical protein